MKRMLLLVPLLLFMTAGCSWFNTIKAVSPAVQTLDIMVAEGGVWAYWQVEGDGSYTFVPGDGSPNKKLAVSGRTQVSHFYKVAGTFEALFVQGALTHRAIVVVVVAAPSVNIPFFLDSVVEKRERIVFNITGRDVGCDAATGYPQYVTGIFHGAGTTQFMMTAYDEDGTRVPLFDSSEDNVWGEWIDLVADLQNLQMITCWTDWYYDYPRGPVAQGVKDGGCDPDDPWIPPVPDEDAGWIQFTLSARNQFIAAPYPSVTWRIWVGQTGCG